MKRTFEVEVTHEYNKVQKLKVEAETLEEAQRLADDHPDIDWSDPEHTGYEARVYEATR